jgi:hypothetical protein
MHALLLALLLSAPPAPITAEALRARHASTEVLTAEVLQVKDGRRWARPLESRVRLRWRPGRVEWETLSPIKSTVVVQGEAITVLGPDGRARDLGAAAADPRLGAVLRLVRALLGADLGGLEREYALAFSGREVALTPREGPAASLFESVRLRFDDAGEIAEVRIASPAETTRMTFLSVVREPRR